jgi:hypothetical protein
LNAAFLEYWILMFEISLSRLAAGLGFRNLAPMAERPAPVWILT